MPLDRRWDLGSEKVWLKEKVERQWKKADDKHVSSLISIFVNQDNEFFHAFVTCDGQLVVSVDVEGLTPMVTRSWDGKNDPLPPFIMSVEERSWYQACLGIARKRRCK